MVRFIQKKRKKNENKNRFSQFRSKFTSADERKDYNFMKKNLLSISGDIASISFMQKF